MTVLGHTRSETLPVQGHAYGMPQTWSEAVLRVAKVVAAALGLLVLASCVALAPTLTLLALALVAVAVLALRAPPFAIVGVIFLFGLEGTIKVRLGEELPDLPVSGLALGAATIDLALVIAFFGLLRVDRGTSLALIWRNMGRPARVAIVLLAGWIALSVLQIPVSGNVSTGVSGFRLTQAYVVLAVVGGAMLARRWSERVLLTLLAAIFVISSYAAFRAIEGPSPSERVAAFSHQTTANVPAGDGVLFRNVGSFSGAVGLVSYLTPAAVFLFALGLLVPRHRLVAWLATALALVAVVGAHVRASLVVAALCLVATGAVVVLSSGLARRTKFVLAAVSIPVFISLVVVGAFASSLVSSNSPELQERSAGVLNPLADESMQLRFETWRQSFEVAKANPLGTGLGTVGRATEIEGASATVTDSSYVKALREQGVPGALLFTFGVLATWAAIAVGIARIGVRLRPIGLAALAGSGSFLLLASDSEAVEQPGKVLMWMFLGIGLWELYGRPESGERMDEDVPRVF